jgi:hypothetical protein
MVCHSQQVLLQLTVELYLLIVLLFHKLLSGPLIIKNALEGHVLGSQATYYLYKLCDEDTYIRSLGTSNLLSTQLLSYLKKKIALCCAIGVPFKDVWNQCLSFGLDCAIGNWKHLLLQDYTDLGILMMRFVTGGQSAVNTKKRIDLLTNKFKNIGNDLISAYAKDAVGLPDITLQDSSTDLLIDPGLIQYNYSIIHQLVTTWLESEVSYDQQRHNKVADIIDQAINYQSGNKEICHNCNLVLEFLRPNPRTGFFSRKPATRGRESLTACHCCSWFRNI